MQLRSLLVAGGQHDDVGGADTDATTGTAVQGAEGSEGAEGVEGKADADGAPPAATAALDGGSKRAIGEDEDEDGSMGAAATASARKAVLGDVAGGALMSKEGKAEGTVGWAVVSAHVLACGGVPFAVAVFLTFAGERFSYVGGDWWLSAWTSAERAPPKSGVFGLALPSAASHGQTVWYLTVYACWSVGSAFFVSCRLHNIAAGHIRAVRRHFDGLLASVLRAPMVFFETTPLGRVTNRFSFDTEVVDSRLHEKTNGVLASTAWMTGGITIMVWSQPLMSVVLALVMLTYWRLFRYYRLSCVELQRLDAISRSPVQAHFVQALQGADSVRAFGVVRPFLSRHESNLDANQRALFALIGCQRWLAVRLELLGATTTFGACMLAWLFASSVSPGTAALCIVWALQFVMSLNFNTLNLTECEAKLTSLERMREYSVLPSEPPLHIEGAASPPPSWPARGAVEFENCVLSYRDGLPPALNAFSLQVRGGERLGIVGRTGAGKSTIATACGEKCGMDEMKERSDGGVVFGRKSPAGPWGRGVRSAMSTSRGPPK